MKQYFDICKEYLKYLICDIADVKNYLDICTSKIRDKKKRDTLQHSLPANCKPCAEVSK